MASKVLEHGLKCTVRVGNQAPFRVKDHQGSSRCTNTLLDHWLLTI